MEAITTETTEAFAIRIKELHEAAEDYQLNTLATIQELIKKRVECAALVEAAKNAKGHAFRQFWEDAGLPLEWAPKYLKIAKTAARDTLGDKNQMRLIGIIPEHAEETTEPQTRRPVDSLAWIKTIGKLNTNLTEETIKGMDRFQRDLAIEKMKPLVETFYKIGGKI